MNVVQTRSDARNTETAGGFRLPRGTISVAIIALTAVLAGALLPRAIGMLGWTENFVRDLRVAFFAPTAPVRSDMLVLAITEETLGMLPYRSPVDRGFLADVLERLAKAEVRAVVIDLLFDRATEPEKDERLRRALNSFPKPVIVAYGDSSEAEIDQPGIHEKKSHGEIQVTTEQAEYMREYLSGVHRAYANLSRDGNDGTVRDLILKVPENREPLLTISGVTAKVLGKTLPDRSALPFDYAIGPKFDEPAIASFQAHLAPILPDAFFKDRIVFIGVDLPGIDRFRTPFVASLGVQEGTIPGVVIHAHAVAQLLDGRVLKVSGAVSDILIVSITVLIGVVIASRDFRVALKLLLSLAALLAMGGLLFFAYPATGYMLPIIGPSLGFATAVTGISFYQQRRYMEERTFIRSAMARYVAEDVVKQLENEPWRLALGGERREVTYIFTDIAGFTTLSETTEPAVLVAVLNEYLDGATKIVHDHRGTIDKFIGDAVVAIFGAFDDTGKHPSEAVACALALDRFASSFAERQRSERSLDFGITRIGVNTGSVIIGNFGGESHFSYTAIGDMVNTAARLEGANKYLGTRICVAGSTASRVTGTVFRPIGSLKVKGRSEGLSVFEPLAADDPRHAYLADYLTIHASLQDDTVAGFEAIQALMEREDARNDGLLAMHLDRLRALINTPRRRASDSTASDQWTDIVLTDK